MKRTIKHMLMGIGMLSAVLSMLIVVTGTPATQAWDDKECKDWYERYGQVHQDCDEPSTPTPKPTITSTSVPTIVPTVVPTVQPSSTPTLEQVPPCDDPTNPACTICVVDGVKYVQFHNPVKCSGFHITPPQTGDAGIR